VLVSGLVLLEEVELKLLLKACAGIALMPPLSPLSVVSRGESTSVCVCVCVCVCVGCVCVFVCVCKREGERERMREKEIERVRERERERKKESACVRSHPAYPFGS